MNTHRFDGRVAVVTGAGRGLGRAYARLLSARGAQVVVNDIGSAVDGTGTDAAPADHVVAEIGRAGGTAVADHHDVADEAAAHALIAETVERFGRIDVLINNAGIMRWKRVEEMDRATLDAHLAVHVHGTFHTTMAAWPHMVGQHYGRIVQTTSAGVFGIAGNLAYATAKGAVIGMMRTLAVEGAPHGIAVNCIAPAAATRMGGKLDDSMMAPELVAPMVGYLAHEDCPVTGEIYAAGMTRFGRIFIASGLGYVAYKETPTIEKIAEHWRLVRDDTEPVIPDDLMEWSKAWMLDLT